METYTVIYLLGFLSGFLFALLCKLEGLLGEKYE